MKKIMILMVFGIGLNLPAFCQVPDKCDNNVYPLKCPVVKITTNTLTLTKRVVKYPIVLTALTLGKLANSEVEHTLRQAWRLSN